MVAYSETTAGNSVQQSTLPGDPENWTMRFPSPRAWQWSALNGLVHGLVWCFPFVLTALLWARIVDPDGDAFWPVFFFTIGMVLLIVRLLVGLLIPRTWWFAWTNKELIIEHGLLFRRRDHLVFARVQYLERRAGPIMRVFGLASLVFATAAGKAVIPAAPVDDVHAIEERVRASMQDPAVL